VIRSSLAWLAALSFIFVGVGAAFAPEALAENFGIPIEDDVARAYVRGVGSRDAILGILIATFLVTRNYRALATTLGVGALAGVTDFATVIAERGSAAAGSLAIHAAGTAGLLAASALFSGSE
jgi:hypothetical protein